MYINLNVQGIYNHRVYNSLEGKKKLNPQTNKTQQENPHTQNGTFKFNTRKASGYPNFVHREGFRQRGIQKFSLVHQVKLQIHSLSYTE